MSMGIWDPTPKDTGDLLASFERRLSKVQKDLSGPVPNNPIFPGPIHIGPYEIDPNTPLPPTGFPEAPDAPRITPGIYRGVAFVDIEWVTPPNANSIGFDILIAQKTSVDPDPVTWGLPTSYKAVGENIRIQPLVPGATYGISLRSYSIFGELSAPFPLDGSYAVFDALVDETIPAQITDVTIARGATTAVVQFTPAEDEDVAHGHGQYRVQIDSVNTFNSSDLHDVISSATVVSIAPVIDEDGYYARVAAIDYSGNQGPWSAVAGPVDVGGVNDSMIVSDLSAARITFGEMSGDRIQANTLDAETIKTSTLTAADITLDGGSLKAGDPDGVAGNGIVFNGNGIRAYQGTDITFDIDADTGDVNFNNVTLTGTFQTNVTGHRVVIKDPGGNGSIIEFWPESAATPMTPGRIYEFRASPSYPAKRYFIFEGAAYYYNPPGQTPLISMSSDGNSVPEDVDGARSIVDIRADKLNISAPGVDRLDISINNVRFEKCAAIFRIDDTFTEWAKFGHYAHEGHFYNGFGQNGFGNCELIGNTEVLIGTNPFGALRSYLDLNDNADTMLVANKGIYMAADGYEIFWGGGDLLMGLNVARFDSYLQVGNLNSAPAGNQAAFDGSNELMILTSSRRYKDEILSLEDDPTTPSSDILHQMRPVTYLSTTTVDDPQRYIGLIAEEVDELFTGLTIKDKEGEVQAISWNQVYPLMIAEIQKNRRLIDELREELDARGK